MGEKCEEVKTGNPLLNSGGAFGFWKEFGGNGVFHPLVLRKQ